MAASAERAAPRALVVWRFTDGLRGHENQTGGLIEALAARAPVESHDVAVPRAGRLAFAWRLLRGGEATAALPDPDLLVGAGHATHAAMLAARRRRGGRVVVMMRPSLPRGLFDLLIVPEHDGLTDGPGVLVTRGALNRIHPAAQRDEGAGLMLVGGPSRHYAWDGEALIEQIEAIARSEAATAWRVASSRRTPGDFLERLRARALANVEALDFSELPGDWLPRRLARAQRVWVSEDSVSMVFEALTAGAATGLLRMPRAGRDARRGRGVAGSIDALLADGMVTAFDAWQAGAALRPPDRPLDEAGRCAEWILSRWLRGRG